ncbi:branched-chain amino acid ABC transporter permease [Desertimonas flava]|uniref:branched-chain amino acid ABC transporter permease n=1 Tax=Desertimonas flava TaxID=2064846 RepID=UPI000E354CCE|nr:branched-chain amino acid ABC transporter permease [Desertimonas flava]
MFDWLSSYHQFLVDVTLIDILLVLSVVILFQCGLFSMATAGFAAIGAYTSALLVTDAGWPTALGIPAAAVSGAVLATLFGLPVLRLRGIYLALGSLALAQVIVLGIANVDFTNGVFGISNIPQDIGTEWLVAIVLVVLIVLEIVHRSHVGRAMQAIRLDERTASGLGVNIFAYRTGVFAASGALAGLAGALEAHRTTVISPDQYNFPLLVMVFTYALVGGVGHWIGAVVATVAFRVIEENLEFAGSDWESFIYGGILVVTMILAPGGLASRATWRPLQRRLGPLRTRRDAAAPSTAATP